MLNHPVTLNEYDAKITKLQRELRQCRNELCLFCGKYKERHLGACKGCRWLNVPEVINE